MNTKQFFIGLLLVSPAILLFLYGLVVDKSFRKSFFEDLFFPISIIGGIIMTIFGFLMIITSL